MLKGLTNSEVEEARGKFGKNDFDEPKFNPLPIITRQVKENPLSLVLLGAAFVSYLVGERIGSVYIVAVVIISIVLGFWNEYRAEKTVQRLLRKISHRAVVVRNDVKVVIPVHDLVMGDTVYLEAGDVVPADIEILDGAFEINEAAITGESVSTTKKTGNLLMGTSVVGGVGYGKVVDIGTNTEFGKIINLSTFATPLTEFQKGLSLFGTYLTKLVLIMTTSMFVINFLLGKNILTSLLFSVAVAMGLTPELMPVIVTVSLAYGASRLAKKHVITKKLVSIENLGNMDILCTDKTGTLTEGKLFLSDSKGYSKVFDVLTLSRLAATKATGKNINPIDQAIWEGSGDTKSKDFTLVKDIPFDFNKRASMVVVEKNSERFVVLKGAPLEVVALSKGGYKKELEKDYVKISGEGQRVIAVAYKKIAKKADYSWSDAKDLGIAGYLVFSDRVKPTAPETINYFRRLNVEVKILTGDNEHVAGKVAREVGIDDSKIVLGSEIQEMNGEKLLEVVKSSSVFARLLPAHKIKIINALRESGEAVGYLGDGINDVPSLRVADVGISVDDGVDAAKDTASIILLKKDLRVLASGIEEGRRTFNNTIKYILMSTSSSFGNMISLFFISVFVKFLPLTALQIIINDGLYDAAQTAIPTDNVDEEAQRRPEHWDIGFIRKYMTFFGPLSSLYDLVPFVIFYFVFNARGSLFQTTWFIQSLATQVLVVFVIRTVRKPFFLSRPSLLLVLTSLSVILISVLLPLSPIADVLGFVRLPTHYYLVLVGVVAGWLILADNLKGMVLKKILN